MAEYTTSDFLTSARNRGNIPSTTNRNNVNSDDSILRMATEELHIKLVPLIMSVREEFYVTSVDIPLVAGQAVYSIPSRAIGLVLRDAQLLVGTDLTSLIAINSEDISTAVTGLPYGHYFQHSDIVLYPTPAVSSGSLRLRYYIRPSALVPPTEARQIAAIDTGLNTVTLATSPSGWTTNTSLDLVRDIAPHTFLSTDALPTNVAGPVLTFASLPTGLAVGDWVCQAEKSPLIQIPKEMRPVLAQMTVIKVLEANGDREGVAAAVKDLEVLRATAVQMITQRNHGERKKIVPRRWR